MNVSEEYCKDCPYFANTKILEKEKMIDNDVCSKRDMGFCEVLK